MDKSFAQIRIAATIERSGLTDTQIGSFLGLYQSTVSRLKNGFIRKVSKYQGKFDAYLGTSSSDDGSEMSDLAAMAALSPALRDLLIAVRRLMQTNA